MLTLAAIKVCALFGTIILHEYSILCYIHVWFQNDPNFVESRAVLAVLQTDVVGFERELEQRLVCKFSNYN